MQNKANFRKVKMNENLFATKDYENTPAFGLRENKPKQSQFSNRKAEDRRQKAEVRRQNSVLCSQHELVKTMLPKLLNFHLKNSLTARVNSLKCLFLVVSESFVMKSFTAKKNVVEPKWLLVDADGAILGRMATKIAPILMGKTKPTYTPHVDTGDYVVVVNAEKVKVTGKKAQTKQYDYYTHFPGGHKFVSFADMMARKPERVIELAVRRMLPKSKLGRKMLKKLKVYRGPEHDHQAQKPEKIELF